MLICDVCGAIIDSGCEGSGEEEDVCWRCHAKLEEDKDENEDKQGGE